MARYITDAPPYFEIDGVRDFVKAGDDRWQNMVQVSQASDGTFTYVTKAKEFFLDWKDIGDDDVREWRLAPFTGVLKGYKCENPHDPNDVLNSQYSHQYLYDLGLGDHPIDPNQASVVMKPGDEVIFIEWINQGWYLWRHHITNLRK